MYYCRPLTFGVYFVRCVAETSRCLNYIVVTLTELRYIVALTRERHFGRAAVACFVSQPTLSVAVRKLEDELGAVLFERDRSDVTVSPLGELVAAQALRVLEEVERLKQLAMLGKVQLQGPLRLARSTCCRCCTSARHAAGERVKLPFVVVLPALTHGAHALPSRARCGSPAAKERGGDVARNGAPHGGVRHGHHGAALHRGGLRSHGRRLLAIKPFKPLVPQRRIALAGAAVFRARTPSSCWPTPFASVGWMDGVAIFD